MKTKRFFSIFLFLTILFSTFVVPIMAENNIKVILNGTELVFDDVAPQLINNRTMVPMRRIFESLMAKVEWDNETKTVTAIKKDIVLIMQIDNTAISVNGKDVVLDVPPQIINNRTLVPIRAVAEGLECDVKWEDKTRTVVITTKANESKEISVPIPSETPKPTPSSIPTQKAHWVSIEIEGDDTFTSNTEKAMEIIKEKSSIGYDTVFKYVGKITQGTASGMAAYMDPPTYIVGEATSTASTTWYASTIIHDSYHSKLYHEYLENHDNVPGDVWTGEKAEAACLEFQINFLEEISAPQYEIDYAKSLRGQNWWDIPRTW